MTSKQKRRVDKRRRHFDPCIEQVEANDGLTEGFEEIPRALLRRLMVTQPRWYHRFMWWRS